MEIPQAVQNLSTQQLKSLLQSQTGAAALQTEGGDFFALLMQMLTGISEGGEGDLLAVLAGMGDSQDEEDPMAMQAMAGMLDPSLLGMGLPQTFDSFSGQDSEMVQLISSFAGVDSQKAQQLYLLMQAADGKATQRAAGEESKGQGQQADTAADKGFLEILDHSLQAPSRGSESSQSSLQFGGSFRQAVAEAQRQLKTQDTGKPEAVDVESLQSLADNRRGEIAEARSIAAREELTAPQPLTEQVRTGVMRGLSEGKGEFVVRLKPEGLGEITVRLTEGTDGAMVLHLTASTEQTMRLLNQELTGLREALRPYGTEVNQAVTQAQESSYADGGYTGAQFDAHQGQHAFYGQQSHSGPAMQGFPYEEESAGAELPQTYESGELHAYI